MKTRIGAVVGAITLIVAAVLVRGLLAGDGGDSPSRRSGERTPVVACSPGVEAVCEALAAEGAIAENPPTFDLDSDAATTGMLDDRRIDAWITWNPAGAVANEMSNDLEPWGDTTPVGSSPLVLASDSPLPKECDGPTIAWKCVDSAAFEAGVAVGDPSTIDGLLRTFPVAALVQRDLNFTDAASMNDVRTLLDIRGSVPTSMTSELSRAQAPGFYSAIVATAHGARRAKLAHTKPFAGTTMTLVVTVASTGAPTDWVRPAFELESVRTAVQDAGVDPDQATLEGAPAPGALSALRQEISP
ncbi:MAG: hypothetical protein KDB02_01480 [Acidimicrobiales bacterium]|nr:hypothetical protein [Acidimicrobiales bacterium]